MALSSSFWAAGLTAATIPEAHARRQALRVPSFKARASSSFKIEDAQACPNGAAPNGTAFQARQLAAELMAEQGDAAAPKADTAEEPHNLATAAVHAGKRQSPGQAVTASKYFIWMLNNRNLPRDFHSSIAGGSKSKSNLCMAACGCECACLICLQVRGLAGPVSRTPSQHQWS